MLKLELNTEGVRALLKSEEAAGYVEEIAKQTAKRCGEGYGTSPYQTPSRAVCAVVTETETALKDNLENNTLLKAVSG